MGRLSWCFQHGSRSGTDPAYVCRKSCWNFMVFSFRISHAALDHWYTVLQGFLESLSLMSGVYNYCVVVSEPWDGLDRSDWSWVIGGVQVEDIFFPSGLLDDLFEVVIAKYADLSLAKYLTQGWGEYTNPEYEYEYLAWVRVRVLKKCVSTSTLVWVRVRVLHIQSTKFSGPLYYLCKISNQF